MNCKKNKFQNIIFKLNNLKKLLTLFKKKNN